MPPFNGNTDQEIMKKVKIGKFSFSDPSWSSISDKAKDFISQLLIYDIEKRPSAEEALSHPWITEMSASSIDSNLAQTAFSNLKNFSADQKMKQATFAFIATQLLSKFSPVQPRSGPQWRSQSAEQYGNRACQEAKWKTEDPDILRKRRLIT